MRGIKYRAYLKKIKQMVDVDFIDTKYKHVGEYDFRDNQYFYPFDEIELMQYTGTKDMNGTKIYEGDYFQDDINIWEVGYQDSCFVAKCLNVGFGVECLDEFMDFETNQYCDVEVIGNIYENPELLEEPQ